MQDYVLGVPAASRILMADTYFVHFLWGFQKCNFFPGWTYRIDAQVLPSLVAYQNWAGKPGRAWVSIGCVQSRKKLYFWNPHEKLYKICIGQLNQKTFFLKVGTPTMYNYVLHFIMKNYQFITSSYKQFFIMELHATLTYNQFF